MIYVKEDGIVREVQKKDINGKHLCGNCKNACASRCGKVADIFVTSQTEGNDLNNFCAKQPLQNYPFITKGYQKTNKQGNVIEFGVYECKNYELIEDKPLSIEERKAIRKAKEYLILSYAKADTLEDAEKIIASDYERGHNILRRRKRR